MSDGEPPRVDTHLTPEGPLFRLQAGGDEIWLDGVTEATNATARLIKAIANYKREMVAPGRLQ